MNLIEKCSAAAAARSINQYCPPRCFELAEKQFRFVIDTGEETGEYVLDFTDEEHLTWRKGGDEPKAETYECRKADDWTYLLTYCLDGVRPKINHTWVIDREQGLVTFLRCVTGENAFYPYISGLGTSPSGERSTRTSAGTDLPGTSREPASNGPMATTCPRSTSTMTRTGTASPIRRTRSIRRIFPTPRKSSGG